MKASRGVTLDERVLDGPPTRAFWERLAGESAGATLVLWLPARDLVEASALLAPGSAVEATYLSATLSGGDRPGLGAGADDRVRLVHPLDLAPLAGGPAAQGQAMAAREGHRPLDEKVQMNAYFAVTITADVISHMGDLFSRDYLVERVEHMVRNTVTPSLYPHVSLGPGQRFASKGSFIVKVGGRGLGDLEPLSGWITP